MPLRLTEFLDVPYGPHSKLDLYVPEEIVLVGDVVDAVLVVFIHGGAWRAGDKSQHVQLARRWASPGASGSPPIVVAVPNYRLSPAVQHPVHTSDVHDALQYLFAPGRDDKIPLLHYSQVWIVGHSAGAHICASLVLASSYFPAANTSKSVPHSSDPKSDAPASEDPVLSRITGVIGIEGIYDIDLLLAHFPNDFYRGFIEHAFGTRSASSTLWNKITHAIGAGADNTGEGGRLPYDDVNVAKYALPDSEYAKNLRWAIVHSPDDTLVDFAQPDVMYAHLLELYGPGEGQGNGNRSQVVKEFEVVRGEHDDLLDSEELAVFVRRTVLGDASVVAAGETGTTLGSTSVIPT